MTKKTISNAIDSVYRYCGQKATVIFADHLMQLGFKYACQSGISFGMDDMVIPESKGKHIRETSALVKEFEQQYSEGLITFGEKFNKVVDAWSACTDKVAADMMEDIAKPAASDSGIYKKYCTEIELDSYDGYFRGKRICCSD